MPTLVVVQRRAGSAAAVSPDRQCRLHSSQYIINRLAALAHEVGSNNPDGVEIKAKKDPATGRPLDGIPFHPYYTVHDVLGVSVFLMIFSAFSTSLRPSLCTIFPKKLSQKSLKGGWQDRAGVSG